MVQLPNVSMSVEEYLQLLEAVNKTRTTVTEARQEAREIVADVKKVRRKTSAYSRKYKAAFKKVSSKYKTKAGKWKKGGFRSAVKAAHKAVKK